MFSDKSRAGAKGRILGSSILLLSEKTIVIIPNFWLGPPNISMFGVNRGPRKSADFWGEKMGSRESGIRGVLKKGQPGKAHCDSEEALGSNFDISRF